MKKFLMLFVLTIVLGSCNNDYYETKWEVVYLDVKSSDWKISRDDQGLNAYYYCTFNVPQVTKYVCDNGNVQAYYQSGQVQQVLPYVRHYENNEGALWTQTVDYDYSPGAINVYVTNSDFYEETPPAMKFRVVIMW
jgi:hypothetical protein